MNHVSKITSETPPAINTQVRIYFLKFRLISCILLLTQLFQLSLALADLVLQMPSWNHSLTEIMNKLVVHLSIKQISLLTFAFFVFYRFDSAEQHINFLLEFLVVLPEEVYNQLCFNSFIV